MNTRPPQVDDDEIPRQNLLSLIPKRSLMKVAFMLLMLAAILFFQRRADLVARQMSEALAPLVPGISTQPKPVSKP